MLVVCARSTIFFSMVLRQIVNKHPTAAEPFFIQSIHLKESGAKLIAPSASRKVAMPDYFHNLRLKTNPTPKAMNTALAGFC